MGVPRSHVVARCVGDGLTVPVLIFRTLDGKERKVEASSGASVMSLAVANEVAGIVAVCGGNASCATCHVYVDEQQASVVGEPNEIEDEMLDFTAAKRRATSGLSCQIEVIDDLDGLVFI